MPSFQALCPTAGIYISTYTIRTAITRQSVSTSASAANSRRVRPFDEVWFAMRAFQRSLIIVVCGCSASSGIAPDDLSGSYALTAINGASIPAPSPLSSGTVLAGSLQISASYVATVSETFTDADRTTIGRTIGQFLLHRVGDVYALEATSTGTIGAQVDTLRVSESKLTTRHIPPVGSTTPTIVRVYER